MKLYGPSAESSSIIIQIKVIRHAKPFNAYQVNHESMIHLEMVIFKEKIVFTTILIN